MGLGSFITPFFLSLLSAESKQWPPPSPHRPHHAGKQAKYNREEIICGGFLAA